MKLFLEGLACAVILIFCLGFLSLEVYLVLTAETNNLILAILLGQIMVNNITISKLKEKR